MPMYYYEIYVENSKNIYTYKSDIKYDAGEWCIVNFINRNRLGLIIKENEEEDVKVELSKIKYIVDRAPILSIPSPLIDLIKWMKDYYLSDYYNVIRTVYPGILKLNYSIRVLYLKDLSERGNKHRNLSVGSEENKREIEKFNEYMKKKREVTMATLNKKFSKDILQMAEKEKAIFIEKKLILNEGKKNVEPIKGKILEDNVILNEEQERAVNDIKENDKKFFLLKGITGSGKTEIYMNLIRSALEEGKGSIFLVPEISLTAQMTERLERLFADSVAILHSKLSDLEKRKEWAYIRNGDKKIVIGARSAIFAPVQNLKYIIIDEEHENTYKQDNNPRYHVKNVGVKRALLEDGTKVILGSATPSFESYYQAKSGDLELIELRERFNKASLPEHKIIDLNEVHGNFSEELLEKMSDVLKKREQILLILNRKAFSSLIKCRDCGYTPICPNCSISLSYYRKDNRLKCNYCGYEKPFTKKCDNCGSDKLIQIGTGTEKIEMELDKYFPEARIVRIDSESVKTKKDYEDIYNDFKNHKYDIMLGTQIIAKGFHFPDVTLVGIINSDIILNFPDFRAGEKTFQLLTQSAGRAGRGNKNGEVIIQTFNGENELIRRTVKSDYEGYYEKEMEVRKMFNYPPFGRLIIVILSSDEENGLENKARLLYNKLEDKIRKAINIKENEMMSAPFKAPIYKMNGRFRYQIFMKFNRKNIKKIKNIIRSTVEEYKEKKIRISIDVDPLNLL